MIGTSIENKRTTYVEKKSKTLELIVPRLILNGLP